MRRTSARSVRPILRPRACSPSSEKRVRHILWQYGGILRDAQGLTQGLVELGYLDRQLAELPTPNFVQQQKKRRLTQLVYLASLVLQSALRRTESRGCHTRTDFPDTDPEQGKSIILSLKH